jgi:hypothetical protein
MIVADKNFMGVWNWDGERCVGWCGRTQTHAPNPLMLREYVWFTTNQAIL